MDRIIDELSNVRFRDSEELKPESFFSRFKKYYEENPRHKYSEISKVVYKFKDDRIDILRINLSEIKQVANNCGDNEVAIKIEKLIDHADLAEYQRKLIEDFSKGSKVFMNGLQRNLVKTRQELLDTIEETKRAKTELDNTEKRLAEAQEELSRKLEDLQDNFETTKTDIEELHKDKSNIYTQFVTILGIFSAIIFASFGGLELLKNILGNISEASTPKLIVFSSFSIAGIICLLFILFNGLSRLTGKSIRSCNCEKNNIDCEHTVFTKH